MGHGRRETAVSIPLQGCSHMIPSSLKDLFWSPQGAAMAAHTADWLHRHPFATCEELAGYAPLLRWEGADAGGHPVLHISIGKAVNECRGPAAVHFANAIVTQLQVRQGLG